MNEKALLKDNSIYGAINNEEEDVVVNCAALFYKEGTEGETFRKKGQIS